MSLFCASYKGVYSLDNFRKYFNGNGIAHPFEDADMENKLVKARSPKDVATVKKLVKKYISKSTNSNIVETKGANKDIKLIILIVLLILLLLIISPTLD